MSLYYTVAEIKFFKLLSLKNQKTNILFSKIQNKAAYSRISGKPMEGSSKMP